MDNEYSMHMIHKTISIKDEHAQWVTEKTINLSRFVQSAIDEEIKSLGVKNDRRRTKR